VQAKAVYRLATASPSAADRFFVDTNAWKFFTYTKATMPHQAQAERTYATFLSHCVKAGATLFASVLSFSELSSIIERTEWTIYKATTDPTVSLKKFREGTLERQLVVYETDVAWQQVEQLSSMIPINLDAGCLAAARANFANYPLDGYDVYFVEQMRVAGITKIVTDDMDYISVPGLEVYTCNQDCIGRAALYKRLT
jgi:predicted nucleic acid-binding protein